MKTLLLVVLMVLGMSVVSCAKKPMSEKEYNRSNAASEKAHSDFDKE